MSQRSLRLVEAAIDTRPVSPCGRGGSHEEASAFTSDGCCADRVGRCARRHERRCDNGSGHRHPTQVQKPPPSAAVQRLQRRVTVLESESAATARKLSNVAATARWWRLHGSTRMATWACGPSCADRGAGARHGAPDAPLPCPAPLTHGKNEIDVQISPYGQRDQDLARSQRQPTDFLAEASRSCPTRHSCGSGVKRRAASTGRLAGLPKSMSSSAPFHSHETPNAHGRPTRRRLVM